MRRCIGIKVELQLNDFGSEINATPTTTAVSSSAQRKKQKKRTKLQPLIRTGLTRFTLSASEDKVRTHSEPVPEFRVGAGSRDVCVDLGRRCLHGARSPSPSGQCVGLLGTDKVEIDFVLL